MISFEGKKCPYCKTEFTENDAIVVCSVCEMPHHKDCWRDNGGCTTFACTGTVVSPDGSETSVTADRIDFDTPFVSNGPDSGNAEYIYCTRCGQKNIKTGSYCTGCGSSLHLQSTVTQTAATTYQQNPVRLDYSARFNQANTGSSGSQFDATQYVAVGQNNDLLALVGEKQDYYLNAFRKLDNENKSIWNWAAFLVTPYWLIYRKMYGYGVAFLAGMFVLSFLDSSVYYLLTTAAYFTFALCANRIYYSFLKKKLNQLSMLPEPMKPQYIKSNGGTNLAAAILSLVGMIVLFCLVM